MAKNNGGITINGMSLEDFINNAKNSVGNSSGVRINVSSTSTTSRRTTVNGVVTEEFIDNDGRRTLFRNGKPVIVNDYNMSEISGAEDGKPAVRAARAPAAKAETIDMREESGAYAGAETETVPGAAKPLNVNTAYRSELKKLPYITDELAGRIIEYRAEDGVFYSREQVFDYLKLKPHEIAALKDLLLTGDPVPEEPAAAIRKAAEPEQKNEGKSKGRRIIDY